MKNALMYTHVASMTKLFNMDNIKILQNQGYKVDVACNFKFGNSISDEELEKFKEQLRNMNVDYYDIPVPRKLSDVKNLYISYKKTKELINKNGYELIHCHSPIGAFICRIANRHSKYYLSNKMIYTAHGFHFFKGNIFLKNFIFKNVEKYGARYTDILITINKEDYHAAKKFTLKNNGHVEYVPGIGIDLNMINEMKGDKKELCNQFNIPSDAILMLSVGEINSNKNHSAVIECMDQLPNNVHYVICGQGPLEETYIEKAKEMGISNRLHLLGYRSDVINIMKSCDLFVFPSKREGLSVALMEAMACGLPCIVSDIRGNIDLIKNGENGYLSDFKGDFKVCVKLSLDNLTEISIKNKEDCKKYSKENINKLMDRIYKRD